MKLHIELPDAIARQPRDLAARVDWPRVDEILARVPATEPANPEDRPCIVREEPPKP